MLTLTELTEKLRDEEETELLNKLAISSDDIVDRFGDRIEERYDFLVEEMEELYDDE